MRWILLSLMLLIGSSQSQDPAPSPTKSAENGKTQAEKGKQKAKQDERGTTNSPLVVDVLRPKKSEAEAAKDTKDSEDKASEARFSFWFNFLLVLFNGILAVSTVFLWFVTGRAANAAKKSADIAESALTRIERAFVVFRKLHMRPILNQTTKTITHWQFLTEWENSGTTRTRNGKHHVSWQTFEGGMPENFSFPDLGDGTGAQLLLGPKQSRTTAKILIDIEIIKAVQKRNIRLYFWGWVTYRDVFDNTPDHVTKFCVELDNIEGDVENAASLDFHGTRLA